MSEKVIIIGAGQAGLSVAYYLKKQGIEPLILDASPVVGGSWSKTWDGLKLFSPREYSSLSGVMMPPTVGEYPTRQEVLNYFAGYEQRYQFRIQRPITVLSVTKEGEEFRLVTDKGEYRSRALVSATGNYAGAFIPHYQGIEQFHGLQLHSSDYRNNQMFKGLNVAIVGSGNSGAQVLAEVSKVANTYWFSNRPITYLDDELDGRYLFELSTKRYYASLKGERLESDDDFSKVVMTPDVKEARQRGVLSQQENIQYVTENGVVTQSQALDIDAIIWCTGFKTNLAHLAGLNLADDVNQLSQGTRSTQYPSLWFMGYGEWTGFASATIIGVQKHAKEAAQQIVQALA